ncbi:hypothetical protein [Helicobacter cappadocius]|uniref:Uncharacterized protein n=1 Tax=Helicobacter cappadocius TaxID=3063998 RepID=A0AA90T4D1_9HELI|nr:MULTISPECIES: hypothetical protein [unclassified Helicobacter]MDO7252311.1 hypothetical protein [Helicobacter sp. faydin-H75]MDP2538178.1 hypothetical protein [Helicobacter sp. faydin-H76]
MKSNNKKIKRRDFFYIEVDADLVIRNMIFFVVFCILIGMSMNYALWPMIVAYKEQHIDEKKAKIVFNQVEKDLNTAQASLKKTKTKNQKFLDAMNYSSSTDKLSKFLEKYFKNMEIIKKSSENDSEKQLKKEIYFISGEITDVQTMNRLLGDFKNTPMSIEILLPVVIRKAEEKNKLILEFYISIEKSTYIPEISL